MFGKYTVVVQNRSVRFKFDIERNISIIRGDSGTGKTTLVGMVADYQSQGKNSGIELVCDKKCVAMEGLGDGWASFIDNISDCIVFIDEGEEYVSGKEFAKHIQGTDNYYVIVTRDNLYDIPYSVDAVYEIKKAGKYGRLKKTYNSLKRMYGNVSHPEPKYRDNSAVIVEDAKAGFQFFTKVCEDIGISCITARGKSNIFQVAEKIIDEKCLIIADGAAFGPEMANVYGLVNKRKYNLFLPESFEWLIINSGLISNAGIKDVLDNPSNYVESKKYFSWEQFFTAYLVDISENKEYKYSKNQINSYYLSERNIRRILGGFFSDF